MDFNSKDMKTHRAMLPYTYLVLVHIYTHVHINRDSSKDFAAEAFEASFSSDVHDKCLKTQALTS